MSVGDTIPLYLDAAVAATVTGDWIDLNGRQGVSFHIDHGTITGAFTLEASNNKDLTEAVLTVTNLTDPSGSAAQQAPSYEAYYRFIRLVYAHTTGTGILKAGVQLF